MLNEDEYQLELRRKRKEVECAVDPLILPPDSNPQVEAVPCDDPPITPLERFLEPNYSPLETPSARQLPPPISVPNAERTLSCPPGKYAAPNTNATVTYLAGELVAATQLVFLDDIVSIPTGELYRIADAVATLEPLVLYELPILEANISPDWTEFEASIVALLGVTAPIATAIRQALAAAQAKANAITDAALAARLRCIWRNRLVHAVCDANAELGYSLVFAPDTPPPGVEVSSLAANSVSSSESQADADTKAGREAARGLNCLYCNEVQVATCAEEEGGAFAGSPTITWVTDFDNPRETSVIPLLNLDGAVFRPAYSLPDQRTLKLTSTVAACFLKARTTEEANVMALALAVAGLDCFIPSRRRLFSCTDANTWGNETAHAAVGGILSEEEILNEMATGNIAGARVDNIGVVGNTSIDSRVGVQTSTPPGMFFGSTSVEAEGLVEAFAAATLRCEWGNHALIYACDDRDSNPAIPDEVVKHFTATYPAYPDAPALIGENKPFTRSNKAGKRILSSALGRNLAMLASPRRSPVYSASVAERQFFGVDGQAKVDKVAAAFVLGQLECIYCNPRIPPVCATFVATQATDNAQVPPYTSENVILPLVVNDSRLAPAQSADATSGVPGIYYINDSTSTTPLTDPLVVAPADYLTDAIADAAAITCGAIEEVLTIADVIGVIPARDLVAQNQRCRYGNRRMNFSCAAGAANGLIFTTPLTTLEEAYLSVASTPSAGNFFTIAENTYEAYAASELAADKLLAQAAADAQAETIGLAQLDCFYESPLLHLYCGATTPPAYNTIAAELYVSAGDAVLIPTTDPGIKNGQVVAGASTGSYALETNRPVVAQHGYAQSYVSPQAALDEAFYASLAQLDCFFESAEIIMRCGAPTTLEVTTPPTPETGTITAGDGVRAHDGDDDETYTSRTYAAQSVGSITTPVVIRRKLFRSYEGQHDANSVAYLSALAQLDCFYESSAVSARCGSIRQPRISYQNGYATFEGYEPTLEGAFGSGAVSLPTAAIRSYTSQKQADMIAYAIVYAQLFCYFVNTDYSYNPGCQSDEDTTFGYAESGMFMSTKSQADADKPAIQLAIALSNCKPRPIKLYTNSRQEYDICSPGLGDSGGLLKAGVVPGGAIMSSESEAEADAAALALAKSLVQCYPWPNAEGEETQVLITSGASEGVTKAKWMKTEDCDSDNTDTASDSGTDGYTGDINYNNNYA